MSCGSTRRRSRRPSRAPRRPTSSGAPSTYVHMHTCVCESVWSAFHTHKPSSQRAHARDDPLLHVHLLISTLQVLKRKKMYEAQRDQLAAQSFNVDQARASGLACVGVLTLGVCSGCWGYRTSSVISGLVGGLGRSSWVDREMATLGRLHTHPTNHVTTNHRRRSPWSR